MGTLFCQILLRGKMTIIIVNKDIVERSNIEQPSPGRNPTMLVFTSPFQYDGIQQIEERGKEIHLPIMSCYDKVKITLMRVTRKLQVISHGNIHKMGSIGQVRKRYLEDLILIPSAMPKYNFGAITYLKSCMTRKLPQPLLIFFHNPTPDYP
jgi:hypothetical protein